LVVPSLLCPAVGRAVNARLAIYPGGLQGCLRASNFPPPAGSPENQPSHRAVPSPAPRPYEVLYHKVLCLSISVVNFISYYDAFQLDFVCGGRLFSGETFMTVKANKITKAQYETLAGLRYALRQFLRFSENAAQAAGITPQQHQAMLAIKGFPGRDQITIGELAERLQILHHSAVGLANRLVAERYVRRVLSQGDRRQVYLALTARGETVLEKLSAVHHDQLQRVGPQISQLLKGLRGGQVVIMEF
jgi:DNA-binding MarR family transcriptional regulator